MICDATSRLKSRLNELIYMNNITTTTTLYIGFILCVAVYWYIRKGRDHFPPGPTGLPILGYLPFLGKDPHKVLDRLSRKYGNVFALYLGQTYIVVLGNYDAVKEAFNQTEILGRPTDLFDFLPDGAGFIIANSTEWTEQRRYTVRALRDIGLGGSKWEDLLQEEIDDILKFIETREGVPLDCGTFLTESISNNITTLIFGKRFPVGDPVRKLVDNIVEIATSVTGVSSLRNFFPAVADFLTKIGIGRQDKNLHLKFKEFSNFLKEQVEERKQLQKNEVSDTFVDVYLKEIENNIKDNANNSFNETNLRGTILTLLVAGTDTTASSLFWLFLAMAKFPLIQQRVHQELDAVLGKDGKAKYLERSKLPYTNAVILEGSRWETVVPLGLVRMALKDTKLSGYDVKKGTWVIPNMWAVHRSPKYWKDPEQFIPERFLEDDGETITSKKDSFLPFSYGKRNCPGETVAKITLFLYFSSIMQKFNVLPPVGESPKFEAISGVTFRPVSQDLRFILRE